VELKIIEKIKKELGHSIALKKYSHKAKEQKSFKNNFTGNYNFLLLMPVNEEHFRESFKVIEFLVARQKNVTLFIRDFKVSLLKKKDKLNIIDYGINDFTKLYLPSKKICEVIAEKKIDVVIDLNLEDNIYCNVAATHSTAEFYIGFTRGKQDKFFNLLIVNNENNPAFSYENLLNSLQMF